MLQGNVRNTTMSKLLKVELLDVELTKDISYLAPTGELWVFIVNILLEN